MTQQTQLAKPYRAGLVRDNPTGYGSYVPHSAYVERMIYVLGSFDYEIVEILRGDVKTKTGHLGNVVVGCTARLSAYVDGERRTVVEVGDCERPENWAHDGARLKDASSDAFKRCSMRGFGLGLHLYSQDDFALYDALVKREQRSTSTDAE